MGLDHALNGNSLYSRMGLVLVHSMGLSHTFIIGITVAHALIGISSNTHRDKLKQSPGFRRETLVR